MSPVFRASSHSSESQGPREGDEDKDRWDIMVSSGQRNIHGKGQVWVKLIQEKEKSRPEIKTWSVQLSKNQRRHCFELSCCTGHKQTRSNEVIHSKGPFHQAPAKLMSGLLVNQEGVYRGGAIF